MKTSRFADEQMIGYLKQVDVGAAVMHLGRSAD